MVQKSNHQTAADAHFTFQSSRTAFSKGWVTSAHHSQGKGLSLNVSILHTMSPDAPPRAKPTRDHCQNVQIQAMILNKHPWTSIQSQLPNWTLNTVFINGCLNNLLTYFYKQEQYSLLHSSFFSQLPKFLAPLFSWSPHKKQGGNVCEGWKPCKATIKRRSQKSRITGLSDTTELTRQQLWPFQY